MITSTDLKGQILKGIYKHGIWKGNICIDYSKRIAIMTNFKKAGFTVTGKIGIIDGKYTTQSKSADYFVRNINKFLENNNLTANQTI